MNYTTNFSECEQVKIDQLERTVEELKAMYEYENQEAFSVNFCLFNDNVKLSSSLNKTIKDFNSLLDDFNALKTENQTLKTELKRTNRELNEQRRSHSVPKRLNRTLNESNNDSSSKKDLLNKTVDFGFWRSDQSAWLLSGEKRLMPMLAFNDIEICDFSTKEKSLRLVNKSECVVDMRGWRLVGLVDGKEILDLKFQLANVLWPKRDLKVGSALNFIFSQPSFKPFITMSDLLRLIDCKKSIQSGIWAEVNSDTFGLG